MNKYELKEQLGAGGHGEVFRAELVGTEGFSQLVAVKRIREALSNDERFRQKFIDEAHIASKLRHPNIVSVLDFYQDEAGRLCLAMELVEGVSLSQLNKAGQLPFGVVVYIITELLRGLGHAHGQPLKLVHRDVTPRNVLVGWNGAVKLSDFGLAKVTDTDAEVSGVKGTRYYISPEHLDGKPLDGRADLFSVGVILYELLTGRLPFHGSTFFEAMWAVMRSELKRPRDIRPGIPEALEAITMRLLQRDRDQRYASAQAVIDDLLGCEYASLRARDELAAILAERFPAAGEPRGDEPTQKRPLTPRRDVNALVQAELAAAHQRPQAPSHVTEQIPPDPPDAAPKRQRRRWLAALAIVAFLASVTLFLWTVTNQTAPKSEASQHTEHRRMVSPGWQASGEDSNAGRVFVRGLNQGASTSKGGEL